MIVYNLVDVIAGQMSNEAGINHVTDVIENLYLLPSAQTKDKSSSVTGADP